MKKIFLLFPILLMPLLSLFADSPKKNHQNFSKWLKETYGIEQTEKGFYYNISNRLKKGFFSSPATGYFLVKGPSDWGGAIRPVERAISGRAHPLSLVGKPVNTASYKRALLLSAKGKPAAKEQRRPSSPLRKNSFLSLVKRSPSSTPSPITPSMLW